MATLNEDIAYLSDIAPSDAEGNIAVFGTSKKLRDSGHKPSDFYLKTQTYSKDEVYNKAEVDAKIASSGGVDVAAIRDEYAIAAYRSEAWESGVNYKIGDFCMHGGQGYRCKTAHTSASWDDSKWELVLSAAGKSAIDKLLSEDNKAPLLSLADEYDSSEHYDKGDLAIKDNKLQIATNSAIGASFSPDVTIDGVIKSRIASLGEDVTGRINSLRTDLTSHAGNTEIHVTQEQKNEWNNSLAELKSRVDDIERALDTLLSDETTPIYNPYVSGPDGKYYNLQALLDPDTDEYAISTNQIGVSGSGVDTSPVYVQCLENLLYYQVTVVMDPDTDEIVPSISQNGVGEIEGGKCPMYLEDGNGLYHEVVAVIDTDTGGIAMDIKQEGIEHE